MMWFYFLGPNNRLLCEFAFGNGARGSISIYCRIPTSPEFVKDLWLSSLLREWWHGKHLKNAKHQHEQNGTRERLLFRFFFGMQPVLRQPRSALSKLSQKLTQNLPEKPLKENFMKASMQIQSNPCKVSWRDNAAPFGQEVGTTVARKLEVSWPAASRSPGLLDLVSQVGVMKGHIKSQWNHRRSPSSRIWWDSDRSSESFFSETKTQNSLPHGMANPWLKEDCQRFRWWGAGCQAWYWW